MVQRVLSSQVGVCSGSPQSYALLRDLVILRYSPGGTNYAKFNHMRYASLRDQNGFLACIVNPKLLNLYLFRFRCAIRVEGLGSTGLGV